MSALAKALASTTVLTAANDNFHLRLITDTAESLHPDMNHPDPIGPHYDYHTPDNGPVYRWFPNGTISPKGTIG